MNARLPPDLMESAFRQFLLQLSVDTIINKSQFDQWRFDFWDELEDSFINSGEPEEYKGVWLREVFAARRLLKSRPAAISQCGAELSTQDSVKSSTARPAGVFSRLFRGKVK